ncbi:UDP-glucose dehydrogenase family protein [Stigmatella aurantiaca]|uniref:UDP-glucose 6-dehydrogenase n=1 Tax=Stigmatella aurantiaca (strain DW4/3-1) TaxID=378806 RepID=Q09DA8_STIAD|nr:UDP-glucose/GDP-mannose dehydrogenase family protein [Stigmatella aurantiaca]ADO69405.1 UDP-glucose 6-dehydrogenase [Stigmatella aurantiaca DW4/3-1]EAU69767.1 UDP-glucose 6-dehydrogenase [Stigmatella aurantiaca DW4/3-1]
MRIAIIGTGYVGLVAGTCFADSGNEVTCVDIDARKIRLLQAGGMPLFEPGLEELIRKNVREQRLAFSTDLATAVGPAQVVFIAVGTPEGESGDADLQYVLAAAEGIGQALRQYTVVVDKSTVPVGTADKVAEVLARTARVEFDVVSNPEFLKEGAALEDFLKPDRVVIGTASERARRLMGELYAPFVRTENPILYMDARSAELTKYAANAMLATRISFMNDVAALCEKVGADVDFVRKAMGADRRIGYPFLFPGVGYGGSCFPKDVKALVATGREHGLELDLLRAVDRTNERQKKLLVTKALKHFGGSLAGRTFGVWGLSFKPKTDDMREAPSLEVIEGLLGKGAQVVAHDPVAERGARRYFGERIRYAALPYDALEGVDALCIVTEWNEFRHPDFERMKALMKTPVILDGRNIYDPERMRELGFTYLGIGRR